MAWKAFGMVQEAFEKVGEEASKKIGEASGMAWEASTVHKA